MVKEPEINIVLRQIESLNKQIRALEDKRKGLIADMINKEVGLKNKT